MRNDCKLSVALAILFGVLPAGLTAQSLGDVAAREQKKKEGQKPKPVRVYTDEDLKKARESDNSAVTILPAPAGGSDATESSEQAPDDATDIRSRREHWRARGEAARDAMKAAEKRVAEIEARIAALVQDIQPNSEDALDPNRLQKREADKQKAMEELEQAKQALATAKQAYEDLEDDARRKSIPPGWLES